MIDFGTCVSPIPKLRDQMYVGVGRNKPSNIVETTSYVTIAAVSDGLTTVCIL